MNKIKIDLPNEVLEIFNVIKEYGAEAYVVGGCVRDSILGRPVHDYDICTPVVVHELKEHFEEKGYRVIPTGLQHGTITVVVNGTGYEITTFRRDGEYSDGRHPDSVEFTSELIEDLKRRDFTINAMAYNDEDGLIDPFNGLEDIKYEKINCVGSAKERFSEDALRILRAIRFASQLNFVLMPDTDWEIHQQYKNLENISVERINSEFCKIVSSDSLCVQLVLYRDVFALFIPELKDMFEFPQNNHWHVYDVFEHTIHAVEHCDSEDLIVRLAVLFHDIGKPHCFQDDEDGIRHFKGHGKVSADMTNEIMRRLKFDNDTREKVVELIHYHDATIEVGKKYIKKWLNKIGIEQFKRLLEVKKADNKAQNLEYSQEMIDKIKEIEKLLEEVLQEKECFSLKDLAINGDDVKKAFYLKEGKGVGLWLKEILNRVIDGELNNNREDLIYWMTGVADGFIKYL